MINVVEFSSACTSITGGRWSRRHLAVFIEVQIGLHCGQGDTLYGGLAHDNEMESVDAQG